MEKITNGLREGHRYRQPRKQIVSCRRCGYQGRLDEMIAVSQGKRNIYYCGNNCYEQTNIEMATSYLYYNL